MGATFLVGVAVNLVGSILINLGTVRAHLVSYFGFESAAVRARGPAAVLRVVPLASRRTNWPTDSMTKQHHTKQNVMKLGHNRRAALPGPDAARPPVHRLREWQAGVAAFAVGNVANFVSFGALAFGRRGEGFVSACAAGAGTATGPVLRSNAAPATLYNACRSVAPTRPQSQLENNNAYTHRTRAPGYAAQSLLSAIGCVQFVSNVLFATLVLKERATKGVAAATALIVAGCALLVSFGDHSSRVYTARELAGLYRE